MCESNNQYALSPVSMYTTNKAKPEDRRKERKKGHGLGERKGGRKKEGSECNRKKER